MLQHLLVFHLFLLTNNIPLYGYTTCYLSIHQFMDICVVSTFCLLWILLWRFMSKFFCGPMFSFLLGIPRSGFAGSKVNMFNLLRNCRTFPTWLHHFTFPLAMYECSNFSTSLSTLVTIYLFYYNHSTGFYCGFKNKFIYLFIFLFIYLWLC